MNHRNHSQFRNVTHVLVGLAAIASLASAAGCGASGAPSKFPPRAEGCEVTTYADAPKGQTENIGGVTAVCTETLSDEECLRQLKDEVCKLGGDVAWGVPAKPTLEGGKKRLSARAAHTVEGKKK